MKDSGYYKHRLAHYVRTDTQNEDTGESLPTYTLSGYLWGYVEQTYGTREPYAGSDVTGARAEITLRGYPSVSPKDRLLHSQYNETYMIDSMVRGDNELILDCYKVDIATEPVVNVIEGGGSLRFGS